MNHEAAWEHFEAVARPALAVAPRDYLAQIRANLVRDGIPHAVLGRDTPRLFGHLISVSQYQGISDRNAAAFTAKNGLVTWPDIASALKAGPSCPRLRSYWEFEGCRYRKGQGTCAEPQHIAACPVPRHPTRKGSLIIAAHSLFLFIRDVCDGNLVGWIDQRLAYTDLGTDAHDRAVWMGAALLQPLREIHGIGDKVWSMALADFLLAADPKRERWVATGAAMIAVDSLLHNHLHRTGVLRRFQAEHPYGPRCYASGGCSDLIRGLAKQIDAREFNPTFPANFPRFVQFAMWRLCSTSELNMCNGVQIDDRRRCENAECLAFGACDKVRIGDP